MNNAGIPCPACLAPLEINTQLKEAYCPYCGSLFHIGEDGIPLTNGDSKGNTVEPASTAEDSSDAGWNTTNEEANDHGKTANTASSAAGNAAWVQRTPKKKRKTLLWVLGWLLYFPIPLSVLLRRAAEGDRDVEITPGYVVTSFLWLLVLLMCPPIPIYLALKKRGVAKKKMRIIMAIVIVCYLPYFVTVFLTKPSRSSERQTSTVEATAEAERAQSQEADKGEADADQDEAPAKEESAKADATPAEKDVAEASKTSETPKQEPQPIEIVAGELGQYGRELVVYEGTIFEEHYIAHDLPAGTYTVKSLGSYEANLNVYKGLELDENGNEQWSGYGDRLTLQRGQTGTLHVPEGWFAITSNGHSHFVLIPEGSSLKPSDFELDELTEHLFVTYHDETIDYCYRLIAGTYPEADVDWNVNAWDWHINGDDDAGTINVLVDIPRTNGEEYTADIVYSPIVDNGTLVGQQLHYLTLDYFQNFQEFVLDDIGQKHKDENDLFYGALMEKLLEDSANP